jgi:hypothetical protein
MLLCLVADMTDARNQAPGGASAAGRLFVYRAIDPDRTAG